MFAKVCRETDAEQKFVLAAASMTAKLCKVKVKLNMDLYSASS